MSIYGSLKLKMISCTCTFVSFLFVLFFLFCLFVFNKYSVDVKGSQGQMQNLIRHTSALQSCSRACSANDTTNAEGVFLVSPGFVFSSSNLDSKPSRSSPCWEGLKRTTNIYQAKLVIKHDYSFATSIPWSINASHLLLVLIYLFIYLSIYFNELTTEMLPNQD